MSGLFITDVPSTTFVADLERRIDDENAAKGLRQEEFCPLAISLTDAQGFVGAVLGKTHWNWLNITSFFVAPQHRGKGIGKMLMKQAEAEALKRGCTQVRLMTHELEAPGFYESCGFKAEYIFRDSPTGTKAFLYAKRLMQHNS